MTLPTSTRVTDPYETDGVQRDFEFDFPAFYNADTGHYGIEVRRLTALDYEVIDKSLYDIFLNDEDKSGYVRFHVAPMAGDDIYIAGDTTRSQQLNLINYGRYSAQSIEKAFDLIVALIQEFVSKVDEETRQRILADQALRDFLLIKFNQFTAEVTTKIDKHIGDINGFMSSLIPMFVCIMRKELAYYIETQLDSIIDAKLSDLSTQVANAIAENDSALIRLNESILKIDAATTATAIAARLFDTPAAGVHPVTGVPVGSYFNVRSPNADSYVDEYRNVGGVPSPSGKSYPTSASVQNIANYTALPFVNGKTYSLNARVQLANGDIVKSTVANNTVDPNLDMTGWQFASSRTVGSVAELLSINNPKSGTTIFVNSYHAGIMGAANPYRGGGTFVYNSSRTPENDGGSVINGWVRVKDFDKWTPDHFGAKRDIDFNNYAAFKACDDFTRSWHIPSGRYKIKQDWQINAKTKITSEGDLSILEFVDCQFKWNDCNFLEFDNFIIERTGSSIGYAVEAKGSALGFRRIYLNGTKIMKSTGGGMWTSGAWVMTWINPYIHETGGYGFFCDTGGWVTGINNITFIGGELYHNTIGFALERCKNFNIYGTAIEGNYDCGIGIGSQVGELTVHAYMEANGNAHIAGRSLNGNTAGLAQNLTIQAGSYFLNGTTGTGVAIEGLIPRQINIQDGVGFYGFANNATNNKYMLSINDPTDSAKCYGSIGLIRTDCPLTHVLDSDCRYLGKQGFKEFYVSKALADTGNTDVSLFVNNPLAYNYILASKSATFDLNLECVGAGVASLSFFFYDNDGVQVIPAQNRDVTLLAGFNTYQLGLTTTWTNKVKRVMVRRRGDSATDTATGVNLISVSLMQYTNTINKVG